MKKNLLIAITGAVAALLAVWLLSHPAVSLLPQAAQAEEKTETPVVKVYPVALPQRIDFCVECASVEAPTLVITGEPHLDRIVPVESTRRYAETIRGARCVTLERTGHLGMVTRPGEWAQEVARFVHAHRA